MISLKEEIKRTPKGGTITIPFGGEFHEKLVIKKSINIHSDLATATIVEKSPTVTVQKGNVTFENLHIECSDETGTCLLIKKGANVRFKNVSIRGRVDGVEGEDGNWEIPDVIQLMLQPKKSTTKKIMIHCPTTATIRPLGIAGLQCSPGNLSPGINEVSIDIGEIFENSIISGDFIIETDKRKLIRKIAICGNTFKSNIPSIEQVDEVVWVCDSAKCLIKPDSLKNFPAGEQHTPYRLVLDKIKLNCKEYDVSVEGFPDGLKFERSASILKIEGTPKEFGLFQLTFVFKKDVIAHRFSAALNIKEKKIKPLKIKPLPNPIKASEGEDVNVKIEIKSSNSSKISYFVDKALPEKLTLNTSTGTIKGAVLRHGEYKNLLIIEDDANVLKQPFNLLITPKDQLELQVEDSYEFYMNDAFEIPIKIKDADRLKPVIQFGGRVSAKIKLNANEHKIEGKLTEVKDHKVTLKVMDGYGRRRQKTIVIKCVKYTVIWNPERRHHEEGYESKPFEVPITATIKEDPTLEAKYSVIGKLPVHYHLSEGGTLIGNIDGKADPQIIKVRAHFGDWYEDRKLEIFTIVKVDTPIFEKGNNLSSIFQTRGNQENHSHEPRKPRENRKKKKKNDFSGGPWENFAKKTGDSTTDKDTKTKELKEIRQTNDETENQKQSRTDKGAQSGLGSAFSQKEEIPIINTETEKTQTRQSNGKTRKPENDRKNEVKPSPKQRLGKAFE